MMVRKDLYMALINKEPALGHYADMQKLEVVAVPLENGQPTGEVAENPVRFVRVPPIPEAEQKEVVRRAILGKPGIESGVLEAILEEPNWLFQLRNKLPSQLARLIDEERHRSVEERARDFLGKHRIFERRFILAKGDERRPGKNMRGFLIHCVNAMTEEELGALETLVAALKRIKQQSGKGNAQA